MIWFRLCSETELGTLTRNVAVNSNQMQYIVSIFSNLVAVAYTHKC